MKVLRYSMVAALLLLAVAAHAMTVQLKFVKSNNVTTDKSEFSKTELKSREYEVTVSVLANETNSYKVVVGTVVSSASSKSMFMIQDSAECACTPAKSKKDKFKVETCSVIATKDNARGQYGIDLNSGYQIDGLIVEIQDEEGNVLKRKTTSDTKYKKLKFDDKKCWVQTALEGSPLEKKTTVEKIDLEAKKNAKDRDKK